HLGRWLDEHDMRSQVAAVGEPMGFGIVTLTSTPAVAHAIEGFPEVELVLPDSEGTVRVIRSAPGADGPERSQPFPTLLACRLLCKPTSGSPVSATLEATP